MWKCVFSWFRSKFVQCNEYQTFLGQVDKDFLKKREKIKEIHREENENGNYEEKMKEENFS